MIWFCCFWLTAPLQYLSYRSLSESGITQKEYPQLYKMLFIYNYEIFLTISSVTLIALFYSLKLRYLRHQLN